MRRGRGEGEEGKDVHSIHYFIHESSPFAPSLFRFSPSPFPPETPDTQAKRSPERDTLFQASGM